MTVREVMSRNLTLCTPDDTLAAVARLMCEYDCGEIPVVAHFGSRRVIGVITDRDITCRAVAQGLNPCELTASDCMSAPAVTVRPEMSLAECCELMEARQLRRVPVVDEANECVGMLSQADLALRAPRDQIVELVAEVSRRRVDLGLRSGKSGSVVASAERDDFTQSQR